MTDTPALDALVEEMARAMWAESGNATEDQFGPWEANQEPVEGQRSIADIYRDHARALLPILARQRNEGIEAAAKVADTPLKVSKYCDDCCIDTAEDIATAIRALKEPE